MEAGGEILMEVGYSQATIRAICERAGVSQGASFHHFATKEDVVLAAAEQLAEHQAATLLRMASTLPDGDTRMDHVIDILWQGHKAPFFAVWAELSLAARTDPAFGARFLSIQESLREIFAGVHRELFGPRLVAHSRYGEVSTLVFCFLEGLAMRSILVPSPRRRSQDAEVGYLKDAVRVLFGIGGPAAQNAKTTRRRAASVSG